jgi:hypothetical protein
LPQEEAPVVRLLGHGIYRDDSPDRVLQRHRADILRVLAEAPRPLTFVEIRAALESDGGWRNRRSLRDALDRLCAAGKVTRHRTHKPFQFELAT